VISESKWLRLVFSRVALTSTYPFPVSLQPKSSFIFTAATDIFTRRVYTIQIPLFTRAGTSRGQYALLCIW
jgi:hypothetical protein